MFRPTLVAFLVLAASVPRLTFAQSGGWHVTAPMSVGRMSTPHALVSLSDGRVLVAGGNTGASTEFELASLASVEIFNPVTETWSLAAPMSTRRTHAMAVRLADGRVLVAGGFNMAGGVLLASTEIYDPVHDAWSLAAPMATPRPGGTATLLGDGRVLVAGGLYPINFAVATAEIYDPVTDEWAPTGTMAVPHAFHTATELADGRVLVVGGWTVTNGDISTTAVAELFDAATGAWTPAGDVSSRRFNHGATRLLDGRVLVAGGQDSMPNADVYDPATNLWTRVADMNVARGGVSLVTLPDGTALMTGGLIAPAPGTHRSAERYDPVADIWRPVGSMSESRYYYGLVTLPDGRALVLGGCCENQDPYARRSVEIFTDSCPSEATRDVQIFTSGFTPFLLPALQYQWVLAVNLTNDDVGGPLAYAPDTLQNAVAITATVTTCLGRQPRPFFRIGTGPDNVLSPGEYGLALIWFYQTAAGPITYTPRVLAGLPPR